MIANCLDHFVIITPDIAKAVQQYETLLGRDVDWQHISTTDGTATAIFRLANTAVELMAPHGSGPVGDRILEILDGREGALTSLAFGSPNIDDSHYYAYRRGLQPDQIVRQAADYMGQPRQWARFRCNDAALGDVKLFVVQQESGAMAYMGALKGSASRLDHVVINTTNPDRALATYGARLNLDLALDRTNEKWGARFLFMRTDDTTIEIIQRLDGKPARDEADKLWGVTYEVSDLDVAHQRLSDARVEVTDVRKGRKAGTRVMRVQSHCLGIPTLLLDTNGE
ncbi:MAG: glyoxalase [Ponticaulis sp.]|nr:glyoxalase [Ponticaulis sp.]|tara:strand:+ start:18292 stop:19140 length:849 start_codon:yes stop_codon:yes gene_type:complete